MIKYIFLLLITHCSMLIAQLPTQEWVARYNSPHSEHDRFEGMVLDKFGNSYLTGWNIDSINGNDIITMKINNAGQVIWSKVYDSGGSGSVDIGQAIAVDDSGNVYVTGYKGLSLGPYDIITIKYDSMGIQKWAKIYNSGGTEAAYAIKIDRAQNIYITGTSMSYAITIKYNTNGDTLWVRQYFAGSGAGSYCLSLDGSGKIYIGGSAHFALWVSLILKYESNGNLLWANTYNNGGSSSLVSIAVDSIGNGAATGYISFPPSYGDYYSIRFTSGGNTVWQKYYNGPSNFIDYGEAVVIDNLGNTFVTGSSWGNDMDYFTIKYNIQGDTIWTKRYDGPASSIDNAYSICLDTIGNCYVTGASFDAATGDDYTTVKYSTIGAQLWIVRYNGPANSGDGAGSVIMGNNSTIYVGGESYGINTGKDLAVVKYDQIIGIVKNTNETPDNYHLYQNYPNPFNSSTIVTYQLPEKSFVNLSLYNSLGQLLTVIVNGNEEAGYYSEVINSDNLSSGVYFYKLNIVETTRRVVFTDTKKLIIIK